MATVKRYGLLAGALQSLIVLTALLAGHCWGNTPPKPTNSATLLFKTNFGPGVILAPLRGLNVGLAWQDLQGVDSTTGFGFPVKALGSNYTSLQLIGPYKKGGTALTASNISEYFGNELRTRTGPTGESTSTLFFNLKKKEERVGLSLTQIPLMINRPWTIGDVKTLYIAYWFQHPADLPNRLVETVSAGNWRMQFEFKTGGYVDPTTKTSVYGGDYRMKTRIVKSPADGHLYWISDADNQANGPWGADQKVTYWKQENHSVPVPVGKWFRFELYWNRSSGSDGRYWAAVDGQTIADYHGSTMGELGLPVTRIMVHNAYTGGLGPVQGEMTGLEIWDAFPCGDGVSCYTPPR